MTELLGTGVWAGRIYSGGWVDGADGSYTCVEPATGQRLADVGAAGVGDVRRAVQIAGEAQGEWAGTPYDRRATVLRRAADLLDRHCDELSEWAV